MKNPALYLVFAAAFTLTAQNAATMANMQAMQQQQLNLQTAQNEPANEDPSNIPFMAGMPWTSKPSFSVPQGKIKPGTLVRIRTRTHYALIYYSTDGWTPTFNSKRYTGPIEINKDTILQAIAYVPNMNRSVVARAVYVTGTSGAQQEDTSVNTAGVLPAGTTLRLVTDGTASSSSAEVGDTLPLKLDEDIKNGDTVVFPKGTPVDARIIMADRPGFMGQPGDIQFQVDAIHDKQLTIPVAGGETVEGVFHDKRMLTLMLIPDAALFAMLSKGDQAAIVPGMKLNVTVTDDTALFPEVSQPTVPPSTPPSTTTAAPQPQPS